MDEKIERILEEPLERGGPVPPTDVPATLEFDSTPPDLDPPLQSASREASSHDSDAQNIPLSKQPTAQDWTGPDDPENASNWSFKKRAYHLSMISLLCFATTFGSSVYTPSYRKVQEHFHVSEPAALLPYSLYILGLAFGPILAAPISETHGRRLVYLITFPFLLFFTLGAGFAQNFGTLLVCRFFAGAAGGPSIAVGSGTIGDMFPPFNRAVASAFFVIMPFLGPAAGPAAGGFAAMNKGWRWSQWCLIFVGLTMYLYSLFQHETYKKIILQRRAKRLGVAPPPSPIAGSALHKAWFFFTVTILRPVKMIFTEPIVAAFSTYTAFNFAMLYAFFAAFPLIFEGTYQFNTGESGLTFLGIGIGNVIAMLTIILIDRLTYRKWTLAARARGDVTPLTPENRLYSAMLGSLLIPVSVFWFAWTARPSIHWICPLIATVPYATGQLLVFNSCIVYLVDSYGPVLGASAAAANGLMRYVAGAAFPLFIQQMYRKLGTGWATSLLAFITLALAPIPWMLFKYGPALRERSPLLNEIVRDHQPPQPQIEKA